MKLIKGNCIEVLKTLKENSVDSVVTDPPYEIGFMGKSWDSSGIANNPEMWKECLRVLKPGGYLLSFSATRTYHRMAVGIEDAGFEIRDMIEWVYGSGFPKSLAIGKAINKLETNEWNNISKAIDNINKSSIFALWKSNLNNVKIAETQSQKNLIEIGICMPKRDSVQENATENLQAKNTYVNAIIAELNLCEALLLQPETKELIATRNVEASIKQLQSPAKFAEQLSQDQTPNQSMSIFTVECDVKEWLNENTEVNHKVEEALKTLRGNKKYSNEEITNVLCAVIPSVLKHTILNQSKTFQSLDTNQKMECVSAINVTITEYTMERLISNTVDILKSKAVDKLQGNERESLNERGGAIQKGSTNWQGQDRSDGKGSGFKEKFIDTKGTSEYEGWGTALKPAHEPICMARKPLAEKTVAVNCLKWGTGGINIDESRVDLVGIEEHKTPCKGTLGKNGIYGSMDIKSDENAEFMRYNSQGRFPANLIHDNSEEVRVCFPETHKAGNKKPVEARDYNATSYKFGTHKHNPSISGDNGGNASRFFKSIIYQAKPRKKERNAGGEGNNHPTVKPIALMEYLINMVTPKGGVVLDPFMGSGTTGCASVKNGFDFIGIDLEDEYIKIATARIKHYKIF